MAALFTTVACRDPRPAPAGVHEQAAIHTHPSSRPFAQLSALHRAPDAHPDTTATDLSRPRKGADSRQPPPPVEKAATLYDRLFAAWRDRAWSTLAGIARSHLRRSGPSPTLHPITTAAVEFFRPWVRELQAGDTERFLRRIGERELKAYLAREAELDRGRLADDALALNCLGMLGGARFDYAGALRAVEALTVSARLLERGGERGIPVGVIDRIGEMDVFLPEWSFEIEVCRHSDSDEGWPADSPLEQKIARVERRRARRDRGADCDCHCDEVCTPPDPCCAQVHYYIAELLELRDWTHRYKAGDLAYIANVAAGEELSREHEMKRTRELYSEVEVAERQSEMRDLQVTDRSSLKREIERQRESSLSVEASATGTYKSKPYSATVSASATFARSSSEAIREAQENAIETVKKAVSEIEKETRTRRSERITTEESEKNLHAFHNPTDEALVTKYFWVTRECRAQLFSYGKQMIAEFIVPEPARLYERLVERRRNAVIDDRIKPPRGKPPQAPEFDLEASDLDGDNYTALCEQWGVKDPPPWPAPTLSISDSEIDDWDRGDGVALDTLHFNIPAGYGAVAMDLAIPRLDFRNKGNPKKIELVGPDTLYAVDGGTPKDHADFNPPLTGYHQVSVTAWYTAHLHVIVTMSLVRLPGVLEAWQEAVYQLLLAEYEKALAEYEKEMEPWDAYQAARDELERELIEGERSRHPFFNREIEETELKRAVIYLMCQDFSVDGAMIRKAEPCGLPEIDRSAADRNGYEWYFWDRLMDWKHMAYAFFDYFWNPMCDWPQRFDPNEPDALFKAFRRAGYARVLVPVSPAMVKDFLWYLAKHEKWQQLGPPFGDQDPRWRNVVFELKHANEAAMTRREGHLDVTSGDPVVTIKGSDRYWSAAGTGVVDPAMIALDIDREIFIDGEVYLVVAIALNPGSPAYSSSSPNGGWWDLTLDRPYAGPTGTGRLYSMGAQAVAPVFSFDVPTELVWTGDKGSCLPVYPLPPCVP
jgi:hypothetical protein